MSRLSTVRSRLALEGDQIEAQYVKDEKTLRELAEEYNCSTGTIRSFLVQDRGVILRKQGRKRKNVDPPEGVDLDGLLE